MKTVKAYEEKNAYFNKMGPEWDNIVGNDTVRVQKISAVFNRITCGKDDRVMDLGSGNGILLPMIEKKIGPGGSITAVDSAGEMLRTAQKKYGGFTNITYVTSLIEDLDLEPESYDVILAFAVFPHIEDKDRALKKIRSFLRDTGRLYIFHLADTASLNEFHGNLDAPVKHDMLPDRPVMERLLSDARFTLDIYIDEPGLNFMQALPCRS